MPTGRLLVVAGPGRLVAIPGITLLYFGSMPAMAPMPAMSPVPAMAAMAEPVKEQAGEEEEKRQDAEEMGAVLGDQKKASDRDEARECPPCSGSSGGVAHGKPL